MAFEVNSVPLSETIELGLPRRSTIIVSSRATRRPQIDVDDLPESLQPFASLAAASRPAGDVLIPDQPMPLTLALEGPERHIIEAALKRNAWNRQATAAELDINRTTLYKKMRKYRLDIGEPN